MDLDADANEGDNSLEDAALMVVSISEVEVVKEDKVIGYVSILTYTQIVLKYSNT